eukprot:TRINITY_DN1558_c0_g1_i7.p1 TRINITY_DN1558_c0_g1~~TRINITY_DN1558_c0_g1_i7.p1  ORF type:complete len:221 (+),score=45.18 TRINITY_DN1558_c0_g1_i7:168-830(+)
MFADCVICHNGYKFKWFRPFHLLLSLKKSKVEDDLIILEWKAGTALDFTLQANETVMVTSDSRDTLIEHIKTRYSFVTCAPTPRPVAHGQRTASVPASTDQPGQEGLRVHQPPSYNNTGLGAPTGFQQPPTYESVIASPRAEANNLSAQEAQPNYPSLQPRQEPTAMPRNGNYNTVGIDIEGLITRACALGYEDQQVRRTVRELQASGGELDINRLLDHL